MDAVVVFVHVRTLVNRARSPSEPLLQFSDALPRSAGPVNDLPPAALLTPVPIDHLRDGAEVCARQGKIAFGSQAREVLTKFEDLGGVGSPVLIYPSHNPELLGPTVSWVGTYHDYVESRGGAHPKRDQFRPPSCHEEDRTGYWAGFYELSDLIELEPSEHMPISALRTSAGAAFKSNFIPEGPTIITRPKSLVR